MSDIELRRLQRILSQNPDDYAAWGQYFQVGARAGAFDPSSWNDSITWITSATPALSGPNYDYEQAQVWNAAEDRVTSLLHQIRNAHQQLSATSLSVIINQFLSEIYSRDRKIAVAAANEYCQFPVVVIDDTYRVLYDEQHRYVQNKSDIRRSRLVTEPRSILDITPQYLIEVDVYHPGSRYDPPDSEPVMLDVAYNLSELLTKLVAALEDEENQEIYHDPRDEEALDTYDEIETQLDTASDVYHQKTFEILQECLDALFRKYRFSHYKSEVISRNDHKYFYLNLTVDSMYLTVSQQKSDFRLPRHPPFKVNIAWTADHVVPWPLCRRAEPLQHPWQVVEYAWKSWLAEKIDQVLLRLL